MAIVGVLASLDEVQGVMAANAKHEHEQESKLDAILDNTKGSAITHHYKTTTTVEVDSLDSTRFDDKNKSTSELKKNKKSGCGCFGGFRASKK